MGEDILELDTKRIEDFIDRYLEFDRRVQQPYGVFSILSGRREKKYQQTLRYFLDPTKRPPSLLPNPFIRIVRRQSFKESAENEIRGQRRFPGFTSTRCDARHL